MKFCKGWSSVLKFTLCLLVVAACVPSSIALAEDLIIFLQDGRTIQAEKVEILGDRIRIQKPTEIIDIPRSDVLSIHPYQPATPPTIPPTASPTTSPTIPPPADTYRDITPQMTDKVRREIPEPGAPRGK
ncbi:MAG TPA: hypothetical protein VN203_06200 [Candidatus Acidoferrum sp.]|nr:hypothetical protein [Candidatus Acidoferrum sp.]